jgi:branched-chain amino acid transport system substrate-binding protein
MWRKIKPIDFLFVIVAAVTVMGTSSLCPASDGKVSLGMILPLSGFLSREGDMERKAALMAVEEINQSGGIRGKEIVLIFEDTEGKPAKALSAAETLISLHGVPALCGAISSSVAWKVGEFAEKKEVPFVITSASADRITEKGWKFIFRIALPVSEHYKPFRSFIKTAAPGIETVAVLYESNPVALSESRKIIKECEAMMGLGVTIRESFSGNIEGYAASIEAVKDREANMVILFPPLRDPITFLRQCRASGMSPWIFMDGYSASPLSELDPLVGSPKEGIISRALWSPSLPYPKAASFYENFIQQFDMIPDYHAAHAHAAIHVIADALRKTEGKTGSKFHQALTGTDTMSVFGPVRFRNYGGKRQQNRQSACLTQWLMGKPEVIWPKGMATVEPQIPLGPWDSEAGYMP